MPQKPDQDEQSSHWTRATYKRFVGRRGNPPDRRTQQANHTHSTATEWELQGAAAVERAVHAVDQERKASTNTGMSGAARPAFEQLPFEFDELRRMWVEATNSVYALPGSFEPQRYLGVVCGRPVMVIGL